MPVFTAAVSQFFAIVLGKTVGVWVANTLLTTALSVGVNAIFAKRPNQAAFETGIQTGLSVRASESRKIIYGRAKTGGSLVYADETGSNNEKLWLVIALADHLCSALHALYVNGREVTVAAGAVSEFTLGGTQYMKLRTYLGSESQTYDTALGTASTPWTSAHRGRGVCYVVVEMEWEPDLYAGGIPSFEFVMDGKPLYDRRLDSTQSGGSGSHRSDTPSTWEYTNGGTDIGRTPALQVDDYLRGLFNNSIRWGGMGIPADDISSAEAMAAANVCEEAVDLNAGGTEPRYLCGIVLDTAATHRDNIKQLLACMAGDLYDHGGRYRLFAGEARTPILTLYDADTVRGVQVGNKRQTTRWTWEPLRGRDEKVNGVRGRYINADAQFTPADYPARTAAGYVTADGGDDLFTELDLLGCQSNTQAQRIAEIFLRKARKQGKLSKTVGARAIELESGDWLTDDSERQGWTGGSAKVFEVEVTQRNPDATVSLVLQETGSDVYDWDETTDELTPATVVMPTLPALGASWPAQLKALASLDTVNTPQIAAEAATTNDAGTSSANISATVSTNLSLLNKTFALTAGSRAQLTVLFSNAQLFAALGYIQLNNTAIGADRYVYLELVRDPSGTPVVLESIEVAAPIVAGANQTYTTATDVSFVYTDTGHGGGSVTYGLRLVSYTAADKLTAAGSNFIVNNLRRDLVLQENKV